MTGQRMNPRVEHAVAVQVAKFERIVANVTAAWEQGRLSEHDRDERIARAEQAADNTIAFIRGDKRPKQRKLQPLDDPKAGVVG